MIYQFRDKKQIKKKKALIRTITICVVFIVLATLGVLTWSGKIFTSIGNPLWKTENNIKSSINSVGYLVRTKASVYKENENLKNENANLALSMVDYKILKTENDQLKELLGRLEQKGKFVISSILTRPNKSPYDTIIIDVGLNNGIAEGMRVYAGVDVPIGKVDKVYENTSLVMLYSNPGQITEGILDGSNASVELLGRGGGNFEMTIPIDLLSDNGSAVVFPGIHSEVIALIDAVISTPNDPVKKIILHSPVNIQSLKWVEVKVN